MSIQQISVPEEPQENWSTRVDYGGFYAWFEIDGYGITGHSWEDGKYGASVRFCTREAEKDCHHEEHECLFEHQQYLDYSGAVKWVVGQNRLAQTTEGRERVMGVLDKKRREEQAGRELAADAKQEQKKGLLINVCFFGGIISLFVLLSFLSSSGGSSGSGGSSSPSGRYDPSYRPPVDDHYVRPHLRSNGTYVEGYRRTDADSSFYNNYSTQGNVNPYTGERGYKNPSGN